MPLLASPIAPVLPFEPPAAADPTAGALVHALTQRDRRGADVDGALSLFVRRARVYDEPVERMLARLKRLLHDHVRPLRFDDDPQEVVALLMRRAITAYYRTD
jgi:hypothetical protein